MSNHYRTAAWQYLTFLALLLLLVSAALVAAEGFAIFLTALIAWLLGCAVLIGGWLLACRPWRP